MPRRLLTVALFLALVALIVWLVLPGRSRQKTVAEHLTKAATAEPPAPKAKTKAQVAAAAAPEFPLNSPGTDIRADLRLLAETIETFRTNFPQEGNPSGSNAEITAALTGRNRVRFAFVPPGHPAINREGELCDRWGTPFFFHAESATRMEIRSAGPDRKLHTEDDIAYAP